MTTYVIAGRQAGKTRRMLDAMLEESEAFTYVSHDHASAEWAFNEAMKILDERGTTWDDSRVRRFRANFLSWEQAADPRYLGQRRRPVMLDNVDMILARLFGEIHEASMCPPEYIIQIKHVITEGNPQ